MFVCHCRAVTDGTIRACIQGGACSLKELGERCGAGTRCGGCHSVLRQLLAEDMVIEAMPTPAPAPCEALPVLMPA